MNTIWNSLELLQKLNSISFWVLMSSLVLGLVSTYSMYAISNRIAELRDQTDATKELSNNEEKLKTQNQFEKRYSALEDELQKTKQAQQAAEQKVQAEFERTHERLSKSKNPVVARSLSPEQKEKLLNCLKANPSSIEIERNNDFDCKPYAEEFEALFKMANWNLPQRIAVNLFSTNPRSGIIIAVNNKENIPLQADYLADCFSKIGLSFKKWIDAKYPDNTVTLIIGNNPNEIAQ